MQDFSVEGVQQMFGGPIFEGRNEILVLGKTLKFRTIFQKYALKLKNEKRLRKFENKGRFFQKIC